MRRRVRRCGRRSRACRRGRRCRVRLLPARHRLQLAELLCGSGCRRCCLGRVVDNEDPLVDAPSHVERRRGEPAGARAGAPTHEGAHRRAHQPRSDDGKKDRAHKDDRCGDDGDVVPVMELAGAVRRVERDVTEECAPLCEKPKSEARGDAQPRVRGGQPSREHQQRVARGGHADQGRGRPRREPRANRIDCGQKLACALLRLSCPRCLRLRSRSSGQGRIGALEPAADAQDCTHCGDGRKEGTAEDARHKRGPR